MPRPSTQILWPAVSLCLLAGLGADRVLFHLPPGNADAFHQRVRLAVQRAPLTIDDWQGKDLPAPEAAVKLLKGTANSGANLHVTLNAHPVP